MKRYRYKFANGELKTIEVEDEIFEVLRGCENEEARQRMETHRYCCKFELNDEDEEIGIHDPSQDLEDENAELKEKIEGILKTLTSRQQEVAELLMDGKYLAEIAKELNTSRQTVNRLKNYIKRAFQLAGLQNYPFCSAI